MKVAIYTRVSTEEQSIDMQLEECRKFCQQKGFEVFKEYSDMISGMKDSRPALDLLMKDAFKGKFNAVIVWKLDRLGRSLQHLVSIVNQWRLYNVGFICITQQFDTTTSQGKFIFNIFSAFAEFEREIISERTKLGLKKAKNVGKRGKDKKQRRKEGYYKRYRRDERTNL